MKGCRNPSPPFTTLHSSGTQRNNAVALAFVGVLRRAAEYFQCLSDFHLQTCCHHDCRILFGDFVADIIHPHPFAVLLVYRRYAYACREHCLKVVGLEIRGVGLLDALNLIGIEPIGRFRLADFVQCLCVELIIVQRGDIVDEQSVGNAVEESCNVVLSVPLAMCRGSRKRDCTSSRH